MLQKELADILADGTRPQSERLARYLSASLGADLPPEWDEAPAGLPSWEAVCKETRCDG